MDVIMKKVPVCPNCGAKFSHSIALEMCVKCKIPDEIVKAGPRIMARWRNQNGSSRKQTVHSKTKKVNKHGRKGVKA